jgi:transposase
VGARLAEQFPGRQIAACLEQSKGGLIYTLLKYDFLVLYPVNPRTLAKLREAFAPSGAKDDPTDAQLALELLRKHQDKLRPWRHADKSTRTLQLLVEPRRKLVNDKTRLLNRLTRTRKAYFPPILTRFQPLDTRLVYAFLQQWPTLEAV